uniref:Uncharacterized protein n=1 Tax=Anguilla anguilla TaxID=7936 RepID=A0A0E9SRG5_ANGAN
MHKPKDYNLAEEERKSRSKMEQKKSESCILVPPLNFPKDGLYQPVYIIPEQIDQCVFATEV